MSERSKSQIYLEALPLLNGGRVELLDNERLISQIASLERRTARGGRESIDHPSGPGARDDLANAALGVLVLTAGGPPRLIITDEMLAEVPRRLGHWRNHVYGTGRQRRSGVFF